MRFTLSTLLVVLTLAPLLGAKENPLSSYNIHEQCTHETPHRIPVLPLRFALKERNVEDVERHLHDISLPKSASRGKHWSSDDVIRTVAPSDGTVDIVPGCVTASSMGEEGIVLGPSRGRIQVNATVEEVEQPMNTKCSVYTHVSGERADIS